MIDDVRYAFSATHEKVVSAGEEFAVLEIPGAVGCWVGADRLGQSHLLLNGLPEESYKLGGIDSLAVEGRYLKIEENATDYLDVTCRDDELVEVFDHFVAAVAAASARYGDPHKAFSDTLAAWRRFLSEGSRHLGKHALAGLFGEMIVLRELARIKPDVCLGSWSGPKGAIHDFRFRSVALEVKTTLAHTAKTVTVHGVDQLAPPPEGDLYLRFLRLTQVPHGDTTVQSLIDDLYDLGVDRAGLTAILASQGLGADGIEKHGSTAFEVTESFAWKIDEATPRIVPDAFVGGAVPKGVVDIIYRLDLNLFEHLPLNREAEQALMMRLSGLGDETR